MTVWTGESEPSTSWSEQRGALVPVGSPIGLLLALTHSTEILISAWQEEGVPATTWTEE